MTSLCCIDTMNIAHCMSLFCISSSFSFLFFSSHSYNNYQCSAMFFWLSCTGHCCCCWKHKTRDFLWGFFLRLTYLTPDFGTTVQMFSWTGYRWNHSCWVKWVRNREQNTAKWTFSRRLSQVIANLSLRDTSARQIIWMKNKHNVSATREKLQNFFSCSIPKLLTFHLHLSAQHTKHKQSLW